MGGGLQFGLRRAALSELRKWIQSSYVLPGMCSPSSEDDVGANPWQTIPYCHKEKPEEQYRSTLGAHSVTGKIVLMGVFHRKALRAVVKLLQIKSFFFPSCLFFPPLEKTTAAQLIFFH